MPQTLTLHGLICCPFVERVFLMLVKLELKVKYVWYTNLSQFKTQEYFAINPKGLVPTLVTDQGILQGSSAIMRYLAEQDTKHDLAGRNLWEKAQVDQWCVYANSLTMTFLKPFFGAVGKIPFTEKERKEMYAEFPKALAPAETHFKTNKFFCGDHLTIADFIFISLVWGGGRGSRFPESLMKTRPNVYRWFKDMVDQDFCVKAFGNNFDMKADWKLPDADAVREHLAKLQAQVGGAVSKNTDEKLAKEEKRAAGKDAKEERKAAKEEKKGKTKDEKDGNKDA